jgi:hypothetical protein
MPSRVPGAVLLLSVGVAFATVTLGASDRVGVYAIVEKVVLEPTGGSPERVQIWGAFQLAVKTNPNDYSDPQRGYLYYSCPKGQEVTCRNEWSDLQSVAGKGQGVGFAARFSQLGHVRKAEEKPASPDLYPIEMGVVKIGTNTYHSAIAERLKLALKSR